jgi:uncharacterized protein (TIGR02996 family)
LAWYDALSCDKNIPADRQVQPMAVYFVYRSHYDSPDTRYLRKFEDATLLDWFRKRWEPITDYKAAQKRVQELFGRDIYGFDSLFESIAEASLPAPNTGRELVELLNNCLPVEGEIIAEPHVVQVLTDDDELELAYYFFDDDFLKRSGKRVAYLLQEDWRLPADHGNGRFKPALPTNEFASRGPWHGSTYLVFLWYEDGANLDDLSGAYRLDGVRVPDLAKYLARFRPEKDLDWPYQLRTFHEPLLANLRGADKRENAFVRAIRQQPEDETNWNVFGDWLEERGDRRAELFLLQRALARIGKQPPHVHSFGSGKKTVKSKSMPRVEEHLAQLCLHEATWQRYKAPVDLYHHWIFFDDLWASAHVDLANAILCYASRWDVLSSGRAED